MAKSKLVEGEEDYERLKAAIAKRFADKTLVAGYLPSPFPSSEIAKEACIRLPGILCGEATRLSVLSRHFLGYAWS